MISLKADNRDLTINAKYSFLNANYASGITAPVITNSIGFADADYVLFGNFGSETSEIIKVTTVNEDTHTLSLAAATKFAHSESTKVTVLKYNKVKFYQTAAATFSASENPLDTIDIQADSFLTYYYDTTNTTGFGWFVFFNATTSKATSNSNAIPYAGFAENSVKKILDSFFSLLNNKELKLISRSDAFDWLNEAYAIAMNELNLVNQEYTATSDSISAEADTREYDLPSDFNNVISIFHGNVEVKFIALDKIDEYATNGSGVIRYYLRGSVIGFVPTPTESITFILRYNTKATTLTSYYDNIVLPDNNFYFLKDYLLFRAAKKLNRGDDKERFELFMVGIKRMKVTSVKRNANKDSWTVEPTANV